MTLCLIPPRSIPAAPWTEEEHRAWDKLMSDAYRRLQGRIVREDIHLPKFWVGQDVVVVCRLPPPERQTRTAAGIHIPDKYQDDPEPYSLGVFLWAGPEGMDVMCDSGYLPGDTLKFAKFSGDEESAERSANAITAAAEAAAAGEGIAGVANAIDREMSKPGTSKKILQLRAAEVLGSVELQDRVTGDAPVLELVREWNAKGETMHRYRPVPENIFPRKAA